MTQTSPPIITGSPIAPQRGDRTTFSPRVDAFITWMATAVGEFGAVASNVYGNAVDAYNSTLDSAASASTALGHANDASTFAGNANTSAAAAAASAGAAMWVTGTTYAVGAAAWSPANRVIYRKITASSVSNTDPSLDATNWAMLGTLGLTVITVSATTVTAMTGAHYVLTNVAATTLTLPATPASGNTVAVTPDNALTTNIIARNGQTIMGLAEDMTLDNASATVTLRFLNNTWRII